MGNRLSAGEGNNARSPLIEIIETLEAQGLSQFEYQLYDYIDIDALDRLHTPHSEDIEVQFTVQGIRLSVTRDGVAVIGENVDG